MADNIGLGGNTNNMNTILGLESTFRPYDFSKDTPTPNAFTVPSRSSEVDDVWKLIGGTKYYQELYNHDSLQSLPITERNIRVAAAIMLSPVLNISANDFLKNYDVNIQKAATISNVNTDFGTALKNMVIKTVRGIDATEYANRYALTGIPEYYTAYQAALSSIPDVDESEYNIIQKAMLHGGSFLASTYAIFKKAAPYAAAGTVLGAAAGGLTALGQAALGYSAYSAVSTAFKSAISVGLALASVSEAATVGRIEAGAFIAQAKQKFDALGLDPEEYRDVLLGASYWVGTINAAIEFMQFKSLPGVAQLNKATKRAISDYVVSNLIYGEAADAFMGKLAKIVVSKATIETLQDALNNVLQETLQDIVPGVAELIIQEYLSKNHPEIKVSKEDLTKMLSESLKTAGDTALAMIAMAPGNFIGNTFAIKSSVQADISEEQKKFAKSFLDAVNKGKDVDAVARAANISAVHEAKSDKTEATGGEINAQTLGLNLKRLSIETKSVVGGTVDAVAKFANTENNNVISVEYSLVQPDEVAQKQETKGVAEGAQEATVAAPMVVINDVKLENKEETPSIQEIGAAINNLLENYSDSYQKVQIAVPDETVATAIYEAVTGQTTQPQETGEKGVAAGEDNGNITIAAPYPKTFEEFKQTEIYKQVFENPYRESIGGTAATIHTLAEAIKNVAGLKKREDADALAALIKAYADTSGVSESELLRKFSTKGAIRRGLAAETAEEAYDVLLRYGGLPTAQTVILNKHGAITSSLNDANSSANKASHILLYFNREGNPADIRRDVIHELVHAFNAIGMTDEQISAAESLVGKKKSEWTNAEYEKLASAVESYANDLFQYGRAVSNAEHEGFLSKILNAIINFVYNVKTAIAGLKLDEADRFVQAMFGINDKDMARMRVARDSKVARAGSKEMMALFSIDSLKEGAPEELRDKLVNLTHWSDREDLVEANPEYAGTGHAGAEKARFGDTYTKVIYYGLNNYIREPVLGTNRYITQVEGNKLYDLYNDPLNLYPSAEEMEKLGYAPYDSGERWNQYIKKIKDAGYEGGYSENMDIAILWEKKPLKKVEASDEAYATIADSPLFNYTRHESSLSYDTMKKYLTSEELSLVERMIAGAKGNEAKVAEKFNELFDHVISPDHLAAVFLGVGAPRFWYKGASEAFYKLFGKDTLRFAALTAAFSPKTQVKPNILATLMLWNEWNKAGRPTDQAAIVKLISKIKKGITLNINGKEVLVKVSTPSKTFKNNAIKALTSTDQQLIESALSGPKVDSFMHNILAYLEGAEVGDLVVITPEIAEKFKQDVTNDTWMAKLTGIKSERIKGRKYANTKYAEATGKDAGYLVLNATTRAAIEKVRELTGVDWLPPEGQAVGWGFVQHTFNKLAIAAKKSNTTLVEMAKTGKVTDEFINKVVSFYSLMANDARVIQLLKDGGYGDQIPWLKEYFNINKSTEVKGAGRSILEPPLVQNYDAAKYNELMLDIMRHFDEVRINKEKALYHLPDTVEIEQQLGVTLGAKPGEFENVKNALRPWKLKDNISLTLLRDRLEASLISDDGLSFLERLVGNGVDIIDHWGSWKGKTEPSYTIRSADMDFHKGRRAASLIGMMTGQESVVVWSKDPVGEPLEIVYAVNNDPIPPHIVQKISDELNANKIDFSTTIDGKGFKMLIFPEFNDKNEMIRTAEQVREQTLSVLAKIKEKYGVEEIGIEKGYSELIESKDYLKVFKEEGGTDDELLDAMDLIFIPYVTSVLEQGSGVNIDNYADIMKLPPELTDLLYAAAKQAEADIVRRGKGVIGQIDLQRDLINMAMNYESAEAFAKAAGIDEDEYGLAARIFQKAREKKRLMEAGATVEDILKEVWKNMTANPDYAKGLDPMIVMAARLVNRNGKLGEKMKANLQKLIAENPYILSPSRLNIESVSEGEYSTIARIALAREMGDESLTSRVISGTITEREIDAHLDKLKKEIAADTEALSHLESIKSESYEGLDDKIKKGLEFRNKIERAQKRLNEIDIKVHQAMESGELSQKIVAKWKQAKMELDAIRKQFDELDTDTKILATEPIEDAVRRLSDTAFDRIQKEKLLAYGQAKAEELITRNKYETKIQQMKATQQLKEMREKLKKQLSSIPSSVILSFQKPLETLSKIFKGVDISDAEWDSFVDFVKNRVPMDLFDNVLLHTMRTLDPKDWSIEDLEQIYDRVRIIKAIGSNMLAAKKASEKAFREAEIKKAVETILGPEAAPEKPVGEPKKMSLLQKIDLDMLRPFEVAMKLDGDTKGVFYKWFVDKVNEAWNEVMRNKDRRMEPILKWMNDHKMTMIPVHKSGWTWLGQPIDIMVEDENGGRKVFTYSSGEKPTIQDAMFWYIGINNDKTRQALMHGNNISEEVLLKGISMLTDEQKELADLIQKDFEDNFDRLRDAFAEAYNMELPKEIFYVPMYRVDNSFAVRADEVVNELLGRTGQVSAFVARNPTYERLNISDAKQTRIRTDLVGVWMRGVEIEEAFINEDLLVKRLHDIFQSPDVVNAINQRYGKEMNEWMKKYINDIASTDIYAALTSTEKFWASTRAGLAISHLGFNILSMSKQITTSVLPFLADAGPARLISAAGQWLSARREIQDKGGAVIPSLRNSLIDFVESKSQVFKHRQISREIEEMKHMAPKGGKAILSEIGKLSMHPLEVIDHVSLAIGWKAVYDKHMAAGETEAAAIKAADEAAIRGQPSGRVQDMPQAYRSGQLTATLLMYTNSLNALWNILRADIPRAFRQHQYIHAIADLTALTLSGVGIAIALGALAPGEDDDERFEEILRTVLGQFADMIPYIGTLIGAVIRQERMMGGVNPLTVVEPFAKAVNDLSRGEVVDMAGDVIEGLAYIYKLPVIGPKRIIKAARSGKAETILGWR